MKFSKLQLAYFGAEDGAGSIVTGREAKDPQVTLDRFEKDVVLPVHPYSSIYRGSRREGGDLALKTFWEHATGKALTTAFVLPKKEGNELRIYASKTSGFLPKEGHVWFVYRKEGKLFIGSMPELQWRQLGIRDADDGLLQEAVMTGDDAVVDTVIRTTGEAVIRRYSRNPAVAREALTKARFRCQYRPRTKLFVARATGERYVEAHHLIPLYATFILDGASLDVIENVFALAPHWHRAIHSAEPDLVKEILESLVVKRPALLESFDICLNDLVDIYGCGDIEI